MPMKHTCIKPGCGASYEDDEIDAYYCPPCNEQRKTIAAEIDAKLAGKHKEITPRFTAKDFVGNRGRIFFNINDI